MRTLPQAITGLLLGVAFGSGGIRGVIAASFDPSPLFSTADSYSRILPLDNDPADIYYPAPADLNTGNYSFPIALLLQGANVDKANYSNYASLVARYGFIVIVANNSRELFPGVTGLFAHTSQVTNIIPQMNSENNNPASPIIGKINTEKLALLGHSFGGAVGLSAIADLCLPGLCNTGTFNHPTELGAGIFYGANLRDQFTGKFLPIPNQGIPTGLLQGDRDSRALPSMALATYEQIQSPPKAYITLLGANHYGITDVNNPIGAIPDLSNPTIEQSVGIETLGRWTGLFLQASLLNDPGATDYVYRTGDALDPNVTVISQTVPEPNLEKGLLFLVGLMMIIPYLK